MDDIYLLISDPSSKSLVKKLNQDLCRIFQWSIFNRVLFESSKFHLIDIGSKRLSAKVRDQISFGGTKPPWSKSAKYLGVILDGKLNFKDFITTIIDRVNSSMWRLYKHSNIRDGAHPYVLLSIFKTWILPLFEYGCCVWIFSIFDGQIHMEAKPSAGYVAVFDRLSRLYYKCLRIVLGVPTSTCHISVCVRLGILPLRYHLALRSLVWYLRAYHGLASLVLRDQLFNFYQDDEIWRNTYFYAPSFHMLKRLGRFSKSCFWSAKIDKVSKIIRDSMFEELSIFWKNFNPESFVHTVHPKWNFFRLSRTCHSRYSCSLYHKCVLNRAPCRV